MAFTQDTFAPVGAHSANTPNLYSYQSSDRLSVITSGSYYTSKENQLNEGDFIIIQAADGSGMYQVDSTRKGVEPVNGTLQKTAYGDLSTSALDPEVQVSAEYNSTGLVSVIATGSSSAGATGGEYFATVGTGSTDVGAIFSRDQIIPRHGQGVLMRYSARFDAGLSGCRLVAGAATASDSVSFGYEEENFGVYYTHNGAVVIYELQVTGAAAGGENATITINGTGYTVPLTAGTVNHNAAEIADSLNAQDPIYNFAQNSDTVVMRSLFAAPETGAFTFSSGTATGTFTQIAAGIEPTRDFTAQTDWNKDTRISTDVSTNLDPSKTNYYSIRFNGAIEYYVQDNEAGDEVLVHIQQLPNVISTPIFGNASFRLAWSVSNFGNTTPITTYGAHGGLFIEGAHKVRPPTFAQENDEIGIGATLVNILTIRNRQVFGTKVNLGRIIPDIVTAFSEGGKGTEVEIIENATFSGETDYSYEDENESIAEVDMTTNTITGGKILVAKIFGLSTEIDMEKYHDVIQAGNTLTVAMRVVQTPIADMGATVVWEEEF